MRVATIGCLIGSVFLIGLVGCSPTEPQVASRPASEPQDTIDPNATLVADRQPSDDSKSKLLAAKDALFSKLSGRLLQAMTTGGPASAISVCSREAPGLAQSVGQEQKVRIGRTGVRLRNPDNQAPAWASSLIEARSETPVFGVLTDGREVALLPIKLQSQCLACHGPSEQLAPEVTEQLAELYPNDQATGFRENELRGWFWIERNP